MKKGIWGKKISGWPDKEIHWGIKKCLVNEWGIWGKKLPGGSDKEVYWDIMK